MAANPLAEFYPTVLQLTAPVATADYEKWLLDAIFRELTARHFPDHLNQSPLKRLAEHLLDRIENDERDEFMRLIDDVDDDGEIALARRFGAKLRKEASALLTEEPPSAGFLGAILLAGHGDWSAVRYLRQGHVDARLDELDLTPIETPHHRLMVLKDLGLAAQIISATLALAFDQVENAIRLGDENLFLHSIVRAIRIAEAIPNCSISIGVVSHEYDRITERLAAGDRDRIEQTSPFPIHLEPGSPVFLEKVISRRLSVLRKRTGLEEMTASLDPLPDWFLPRIRQARSVRLALREVSLFREKGLELGRLPKQSEYEKQIEHEPAELPDEERDYDKLWADWMDLAPAVVSQLLVPTKAMLLAWWASEASREQLAGEPPEVNLVAPNGTFRTHVIEIRLRAAGQVVELRQLALCEAPNRNQQLANQVEGFLNACTGVPVILGTKGFPKGRTAQVAPSLRKLDAMVGLQLDLSDTEWHILQRAKDFAEQQTHQHGFLEWRRDRQWLTQLISPLQPLIALPSAPPLEPTGSGAPAPTPGAATRPQQTQLHVPRFGNGAFPVLVGRDATGNAVIWDPYRDAPNHLNNFSFLVTGDAGSGKTQTIRVLIDAACEAGFQSASLTSRPTIATQLLLTP
jgi:hypothetical protein